MATVDGRNGWIVAVDNFSDFPRPLSSPLRSAPLTNNKFVVSLSLFIGSSFVRKHAFPSITTAECESLSSDILLAF